MLTIYFRVLIVAFLLGGCGIETPGFVDAELSDAGQDFMVDAARDVCMSVPTSDQCTETPTLEQRLEDSPVLVLGVVSGESLEMGYHLSPMIVPGLHEKTAWAEMPVSVSEVVRGAVDSNVVVRFRTGEFGYSNDGGVSRCMASWEPCHWSASHQAVPTENRLLVLNPIPGRVGVYSLVWHANVVGEMIEADGFGMDVPLAAHR